MKSFRAFLLLGGALALLGTPPESGAWQPHDGNEAIPLSRDYPVKPVPFTAVHFHDAFWLPRIETNRTVTIPFAFRKCEETGRLYNFERAAAALRGEALKDKTAPGYPFDDTDVYKVIEGASYTLGVVPDPKLEAYVDSLVAKIGAAQEPDGYLYTTRTIDPVHPHIWSGTRRWEQEEVLSHELYNLGHLYEAAAAYYQATGKRQLLDIALRTANLLDSTFGPGKQTIWPGHQIAEMGLVKLYRAAGDARYLNLAKFLLDSRGGGQPYNQAQLPVVQQTEAVGHAVRATYMYSGMADVAALTGDMQYIHAIDRLWESVAGKKLYITGGIGATAEGEAFGKDYELPNLSAYNETCAAIGNDYWNLRLFLLHADARYIDVMERTLYNSLISGVALNGKAFFYPNPLESTGQHQRSPWFGCACCPGNITRFLASVPGYVYAQSGTDLYVNLFVDSTSDIRMDHTSVKLVQQTRYPWDGAVKMTVTPRQSGDFTIHVRIPGWARNEALPTDLYRFADRNDEPVVVKVNGKPVPIRLDKGYVALNRCWNAGDVIELSLPMPIRRVIANPAVEADRGRIALQRGPIVFCAEWPDTPDGHVRNLMLPRNAALKAEFRPDLFNGVVRVTGRAMSLASAAQGRVTRREQRFAAIPYYAWAHRGSGEMMVWLPETESAARPLPPLTIASSSTVASSVAKNARAIQDEEVPPHSWDRNPYADFDWTPHVGTTDWVEYDFAKPARVSSTAVFWIDNRGHLNPDCGTPKSWRILYRDGDQWKPVANREPYAAEQDRFNKVTFVPVVTSALRLEVVEQPEWSAGIHEWRVE
jgi:DUF1680 family protein